MIGLPITSSSCRWLYVGRTAAVDCVPYWFRLDAKMPAALTGRKSS